MRQPGMNLVCLYEYGLVCLREHLLKSDVSAHPRPTSQVNGTSHQSPVLHMYSHGLMLFHSTALPLARPVNQRASSSMSATVLYCTSRVLDGSGALDVWMYVLWPRAAPELRLQAMYLGSPKV